jgi:hypothetical protein
MLAGVAALAFEVDYYRALGGESLTAVTGAESRMLAASWVELATLLVAGVPFILWFRAAYRLAKERSEYAMRYGIGWTIGGWIIPIVNLILPKKIANDLWRAGDPAWSQRELRPQEVSPLVHWWWAAWVLWYIASGVAERLYDRAETISAIRGGVMAYIVSDAVWLVAAVLATFVVRGATERLTSLPPRTPAEEAATAAAARS